MSTFENNIFQPICWEVMCLHVVSKTTFGHQRNFSDRRAILKSAIKGTLKNLVLKNLKCTNKTSHTCKKLPKLIHTPNNSQLKSEFSDENNTTLSILCLYYENNCVSQSDGQYALKIVMANWVKSACNFHRRHIPMTFIELFLYATKGLIVRGYF